MKRLERDEMEAKILVALVFASFGIGVLSFCALLLLISLSGN